MILLADSEDIAEHWIIVVFRGLQTIRCVESVEILKDELARAVFLEGYKVDSVIRFVSWRKGSEVGSVVWLAAGVCHWGSVSEDIGNGRFKKRTYIWGSL